MLRALARIHTSYIRTPCVPHLKHSFTSRAEDKQKVMESLKNDPEVPAAMVESLAEDIIADVPGPGWMSFSSVDEMFRIAESLPCPTDDELREVGEDPEAYK